jgi:predicted dehydrogenase
MPINIIYIGVGLRGRHWLEYVRDYPDAVSVACVDPEPQALNEVKTMFGQEHCQYFADLDTALRDTSPDAALIASPSALHVEHALQALEAGLAVMVEKPFAPTVADARRILKKANAMGKPVVVAENYRFARAERTVRKVVQDGLLGPLRSVTLIDRRRLPSHEQGPWVADMAYPHLKEIAIHHFDSLRSWLGCQPVKLAVQVFNPPGSDYRHGACTQALIEMEGDVHVQYLGTLTSHRYSFSLWIEGEKGVLWTNRKWIGWRPRGKRLFWPLKQVRVPKGDEVRYPREGTTSLLNSLRDAVLHGQEAESSGRDNVWTLAMVEAAMRSAEAERTVSIREILGEVSPLAERGEFSETDHG